MLIYADKYISVCFKTERKLRAKQIPCRVFRDMNSGYRSLVGFGLLWFNRPKRVLLVGRSIVHSFEEAIVLDMSNS